MGSASELGFGSPYLHACDPDERALGFGVAKSRSALGVLLTYTHRRSRTVMVRDSDPAVRPRSGPRDDCAAVAKGCGRAMPGGEFFDVVLDGSRLATVPASFKH